MLVGFRRPAVFAAAVAAMRRRERQRLAMLLGPGAFLLAGWLLAGQASEPPPERPISARQAILASGIRVVDGDTIEFGGNKFRHTGYNTPETHFAKCSS